MFLLILARTKKLSKERDVMMMMREILIGDFIFNNERLFLVTLFLSKTRSFCYSFLRNSHTDTEEKDSRTFLGREGALSLFDLLSHKNTKREERVLTNEFPSLSSLSLLSNTFL